MTVIQQRHGACQCGAITYRVTGDALLTYACHCLDCQKRTGSACSMGMVFPEQSLQLQGELVSWQRTSDKGNSNTRFSCACCGNNIYGIGSNMPGLVKLQPGTLADTSGVFAEAHLWTRSAQPWVIFADKVPQYPTQPDDVSEVLTAVLEYRQLYKG